MSNAGSSPAIKKWVFIGGAPRSGTSLLQAIMNQHSECFSPPESHILETFVYAPTTKTIEEFGDKEKLIKHIKEDKWIHRLGIDPEKIVARLQLDSNPLELFKLYMQDYADVINKNILIEGGPINIWFLKKLHADFPNCYFLHIVRDPRDVVLSTMKVDYNSTFDFPPYQIAHQYMIGYRNAENFSHLYGNRYLKMYYEDLVSNPEKVVRQICDVLGIGFHPNMLEFNKHSGEVYAKEETWKKNLTQPFIKDNFGKWKTAMNKKDLVIVEGACETFFEKENSHYKKSDVRKQIGSIVYFTFKANFYLTELKNRINDKRLRTIGEMDKMPVFVRMKHNGILENN